MRKKTRRTFLSFIMSVTIFEVRVSNSQPIPSRLKPLGLRSTTFSAKFTPPRPTAYIVNDYYKKKSERERTWLNQETQNSIQTLFEKNFFNLAESEEKQLLLFLLAIQNKEIVNQYIENEQELFLNLLDLSIVGNDFFQTYDYLPNEDREALIMKLIFINQQPNLPIFFQVYNDVNREKELLAFYTRPHIPFHWLDKNELGFYLAGLLEGDGGCNKSDLHISFNRTEVVVAENLIRLFPNGYITFYENDKNHRGTKFNLNGENMIPFLELIDGKIVCPNQVEQINNCAWLKKRGYSLQYQATKKVLDLAWVCGFFEADGSFGSRLPKTTETNDYPLPYLTINFTQKDKYPLLRIADFFPQVEWHFSKGNRDKTDKNKITEHNLVVFEGNLDSILPFFKSMTFQGKSHELSKVFFNLYELKKEFKKTGAVDEQQRKNIFSLHKSVQTVRHGVMPDVYRYNFSLSSKARTSTNLSLKQMDFILELRDQNVEIKDMIQILEANPNIRGIKANSSPANFPTRAVIRRFLENPPAYFEMVQQPEQIQKKELLAFIEKNKTETPGITENELKRRLGNACYAVTYHEIEL